VWICLHAQLITYIPDTATNTILCQLVWRIFHNHGGFPRQNFGWAISAGEGAKAVPLKVKELWFWSTHPLKHLHNYFQNVVLQYQHLRNFFYHLFRVCVITVCYEYSYLSWWGTSVFGPRYRTKKCNFFFVLLSQFLRRHFRSFVPNLSSRSPFKQSKAQCT